VTARKKRKQPLPPSAKETARVLLSASTQAKTKFQTYIQGCHDALDLEGDWNLNTQTWEFEPVEQTPKSSGGE